MHSLVKEQKKSTFTVPFLGPSGRTKNETAKSQINSKCSMLAHVEKDGCITPAKASELQGLLNFAVSFSFGQEPEKCGFCILAFCR